MPDAFTLRTAGGARLWVNPDGEAFTRPIPLGTHPEVTLLVPARPGIAVLVPSDATTPLHVGAHLRGGPVLPVRLRWAAGRTAVTLHHPYTGACLSAPAASPGDDRGTVTSHPTAPSVHDVFQVVPATPPPPALAAAAALLDRLAAVPLTGPAILALLEQGIHPGGAAMFGAYARLLTLDQLEWLSAALLRSAPACAALAAAFPGDPFATEALPRLAWWNAARMPTAGLDLPASGPDLSRAGQDGIHVSLPHVCNALARRSVAPRRTVAVVAAARNEGLYLLEWVAHYRSIGVDHIFLYSNDNADGSEALLNLLAQAGVITWIKNPVPPGRIAQFQAYGHAFGMLPHVLDYRWTLLVDLDELLYLDPARFASLPDYLAWQEAQPVDAIAFNWVVFGSGGEARWRDAPMAERFGHRMPYTDVHVKVAVRSGLPMHAYPHRAVFDPRQAVAARNASGGHYAHTGDPSIAVLPEEDAACVSHYYFKSAEEWAWKSSRNRGDQGVVPGRFPNGLNLRAAKDFLDQHGAPRLLADTRMVPGGPARAAELARLLALPGAFQAMQAIKFLYGEQMAEFRAAIQADAAQPGADPAARAMLAALGVPTGPA